MPPTQTAPLTAVGANQRLHYAHKFLFDISFVNTFYNHQKRAVWEVIEGYRDPNIKVQKPINYEGILLKRRNWPMKGWHKRYFILADGILTYGKSKTDVFIQT